MPYLVFSQPSLTSLDVGQLARHARRFFGATFELRGRPEGGEVGELDLALAGAEGAAGASFRARVRRCVRDDYEAAEGAERAGAAGGMGQLARRCAFVWEIERGEAGEAELLRLCAILASVLLGPVMPPEKDTLFGVRGARERAERLERSCILR